MTDRYLDLVAEIIDILPEDLPGKDTKYKLLERLKLLTHENAQYREKDKERIRVATMAITAYRKYLNGGEKDYTEEETKEIKEIIQGILAILVLDDNNTEDVSHET